MMRIVALSAVLVVLFSSIPPSTAADCPGRSDNEPRTLILALDGVPYRVMRTAREMGAFEGWGETRPLVSPFPSMTNVSFAAILSPFGAPPVPGYEMRRYDPATNKVSGGGIGDTKFEWRKEFDLQQKGFWSKVGVYMTPRKNTLKEVTHLREFVLDSSDEIIMALISSTDSLTHLQGDAVLVRTLLRIADELEEMRRLHRQTRGRDLDVVMISDHGNTNQKVRRSSGFKQVLRRAGLRPAKSLQELDDVVTVTYGIVGYGVLYLDPSRAETAARAILDLRGVQLAAWRPAPNEVRVVSGEGDAVIRWRDDGPQRSFAYLPQTGDPLELREAQDGMQQAGLIGRDGFARRDDWFEWTAFGTYPDAVARLVDSLVGVWVSNAATVVFSFESGSAWGARSAGFAARFRTGMLAETHGSLDRESTWGFFLASDPALRTPRAVRADQALLPWAEMSRCTTAALVHVGEREAQLHRSRIVAPD